MAESQVPSDANRERLRAYFSGTTAAEEHQGLWSKMWDEGSFLPFDRGVPNPALEDILTDRRDLIGNCFVEDESGEKKRKRALVPGCGRGYDVLLLASFGYDAFGLELGETATRKAREEHKKNGHKYPVRDEAVGAGTVTFVTGDFYKEDWVQTLGGTGTFELIYDYTFLCAMLPSVRPAWALTMSRLLAPAPVGNLICLEFPTYKPPSTGGPPYGLTPKTYLGHLSHPGEDLPYDDSGHIVENDLRRASPGGLERVAHWQPERTHAVGQGKDWVSIWRHL